MLKHFEQDPKDIQWAISDLGFLILRRVKDGDKMKSLAASYY